MKNVLKFIYYNTLKFIPYLNVIYFTKETQTPVKLKHFLWQKILRINSKPYWPVHFTSIVSFPKNIYCGIETSPGYSPGNYIQGYGTIYIGDYTQIGPNVGIISSNHDIYDNSKHVLKKIIIGKYCWIGMGAIIMPGITLGDYTIVGAGSIVTKSFKDGYCIIGGNPAKLIRLLNKEKCVFHKSVHEYNGFIPNKKFETFRKGKLNV